MAVAKVKVMTGGRIPFAYDLFYLDAVGPGALAPSLTFSGRRKSDLC